MKAAVQLLSSLTTYGECDAGDEVEGTVGNSYTTKELEDLAIEIGELMESEKQFDV